MSDTPGAVENLVLMAGGHPKVPQATLEEMATAHDADDARRDAVLRQGVAALHYALGVARQAGVDEEPIRAAIDALSHEATE